MAIRSKNKKVNRAWLHDHLNDPYVKMAQREGYRARAAYKLKELDETFKLVRPGDLVVDLGATPGAWSQYLRRRMARSTPTTATPAGAGQLAATPTAELPHLDGTIIALDVLDFEPVDGVQFIQGDFREDEVLARLETALNGRVVDLVVSDMAPNLSGIESADAARMADLVELALHFAASHLKSGGAMVAKVFHGSGYSQLVKAFKQQFQLVKPHKPKSSRDRSAETFLVGLGHKPGGAAK